MEETPTNRTEDASPTPSKFKQAGTGAAHALLVLLKYILYGWAARIVLGLWFAAAFVPGIIVTGATNAIGGFLVGLLTFIGIGFAYGAYKTRQE